VSIVSQNTEKYGTVKISVADPYPGSGMGKKSGSVMNISDHISKSVETNFWVKNT